MKRKKIIMSIILLLLMFSLVACGSDVAETIAPVTESETVTSTAADETTEEPANEVDPNATYVEVNELEYEKNTEVTTNGVLYVGNNIETLDVINVNWKLTNVVMEDVEDGMKQLTIEQFVEGYIWTDGNIFATNLNVPVARLANAYDGQMIAVGDEDAVETELAWKDNTYTVSAVETISWEDDDWNDGWYSDPNGDGERLNSRLIVKTVVTISEDYDGLVLVLTPIVDANGSADGDYIMDAWTNDSHLFNVNDMSENFIQFASAEDAVEDETVDVDSEEVVKEETKTETAKTNETTSTTTNTTQKEESKTVAHTHNYNGVVTTQATCTVSGVKTYTCSCGDSYTESLGTSAHDYSIPITESVYHEEQWTTEERQLPAQKVIWCGCGAEFTSDAEFDAHCVANVEAYGPFIDCAGNYMVYTKPGETVYDRVKVSDAYTSEEIVGYKCSVCGQTRN